MTYQSAKIMSQTITASFNVVGWEPTVYDEPTEGPEQTRITIRKEFAGDVTGSSVGEGLFCGMNNYAAGAGYLVSERFTGSVVGKSGTFVVQHGGIAAPDAEPVSFGTIVPGSGTGDLAGISGSATFGRNADGHALTLEITLA